MECPGLWQNWPILVLPIFLDVPMLEPFKLSACHHGVPLAATISTDLILLVWRASCLDVLSDVLVGNGCCYQIWEVGTICHEMLDTAAAEAFTLVLNGNVLTGVGCC